MIQRAKKEVFGDFLEQSVDQVLKFNKIIEFHRFNRFLRFKRFNRFNSY